MPTNRRVMIDHVDLLVADLDASRRFYASSLAMLGFREMARSETYSVYGVDGSEDFAINLIAPSDRPTTWAHVAFVADSRADVEAWFQAALIAGGTAKQPPAEFPAYHPGYYGAFVWDPDGNNVEAVYHGRPKDGN